MKKVEINKIVSVMSKRHTAKLKSVREALNDMICDREKTKGMWFWKDNGNTQQRHRKEVLYDVKYRIELFKGYSIMYSRDFSQSRRNTFARDSILDTEGRKVTVADLKKLIEGIDAVLSHRK